ncbi:MAG: CooT family nickel-binding protein [Syntrophothermus sp.]
MCEASAYVVRDGQEELVFQDVAALERDGNKLLLIGLFGEQKLIEGEITKIDLLTHKIYLKKA